MTDSEGSGPESRALDCVSLFSHNFNKKKKKENKSNPQHFHLILKYWIEKQFKAK